MKARSARCPYHVPTIYGKHYVYALVDPRNDTAFYIGYSGNPLHRYGAHLQHDYSGSGKGGCIKAILKAGLMPELWILAELEDRGHALAIEKFFIRQLARQPACTNSRHEGKGGRDFLGELDITELWPDKRFKNLHLPRVGHRMQGADLRPRGAREWDLT